MINAPNNIFNNWNKVCYIARKLPPSEDEFGNELDNVYEEPQKMIFNYQPVKDESELRAYGITEMATIKAYLDVNEFTNKIDDWDLAYLYGATPDDESYHGENANYRVITAIPQNMKILVYFTKLVKTQKEV